jgi:hypothetical protein
VRRLLRLALFVAAAVLGAYGLLVADVSRALGSALVHSDRAAETLERYQAMKGQPESIDSTQVAREGGVWQVLQAFETSKTFAYGRGSSFEHTMEYLRLPRFNRASLLLHTSMAAFCMLAAPLQFWPTVRRRWPRAHRLMGRTYVATILLSMLGAAAFLATTPPAAMFAGLPFYRGLSIVCGATTATILLALYFIRRGDVVKHQIFMSLNFGFLVSAPMLRIDWTILGFFVRDRTQVELHQFTENFLGPQCLLVGYALFCAVRATEPLQSTPAPLPPWLRAANRVATAGLLAFTLPVAVGVVVLLDHYLPLHFPPAGILRYPIGLAARESVVGAVVPLLPATVVLSMSAAAVLALATARQFLRIRPSRSVGGLWVADAFTGVFAASTAASFLYGTAVGLPSDQVPGGGTLFLTYGLIGGVLSAALFAIRGTRLAVLNGELTGLSVALALGVPLCFFRLWASARANVSVPDAYNLGIAPIQSLLPLAFLGVCYSSPTRLRSRA